jgi:hypothetical protein
LDGGDLLEPGAAVVFFGVHGVHPDGGRHVLRKPLEGPALASIPLLQAR